MSIANRKKRPDNHSGVIGVHFHIRRRRWYSQIQIRKTRVNLGSFETKPEAIAARQAAEKLAEAIRPTPTPFDLQVTLSQFVGLVPAKDREPVRAMLERRGFDVGDAGEAPEVPVLLNHDLAERIHRALYLHDELELAELLLQACRGGAS